MCGEHRASNSASRCASGSSPRVRGTPWDVPFEPRSERFIPACAGNTATRTRTCGRCPVHPRVCGEHRCGSRASRERHGSSPRVRGTRTWRGRGGRRPRFIPACAGNTVFHLFFSLLAAVHPRVCGEHLRGGAILDDRAGSSPRVRGTPPAPPRPPHKPRFIPACAGNTSSAAARRTPPAVHPRVCGEHPPPPPESPAKRRAVHPRVCGEHVMTGLEHAVAVGSSPRVRGTPSHSRAGRRPSRFIPACAGNTAPPRPPPNPCPVHPRVCGEH